MPLDPTKRHGRNRTSGFTLLEILVTLIVLGVAATLVAPVFRADAPPDDDLRAVLTGARETAVRRAQTLVLTVDQRGAWRISAAHDSTTVANGHLADGTGNLQIRVTPLGACLNEGANAAIPFDAVGCAIAPRGIPAR
jgi:prepilin-type N-terminal cleavage/methylation domain-containing protein